MNHVYSEEAIELLNAILRSIFLTSDRDAVSLRMQQETFQEVLDIAKAQDIYLLVLEGIKKAGGVLSSEIEKNASVSIFKYFQNEYMFERTKELLAEQRIPFMSLKGVAIRDMYPQPWMRNSCDVDILVHEKDLLRAMHSLTAMGFTTDEKRNYHDITLHYGITHLELHFNICENIPRIDKTLSQVWKYAEPISDYEYREKIEFFVYHQVAHLLYHFLRGGCSLKQFIDLWLLRKNESYEEEKLKPLLAAGRLERFYAVICEITDIWFNGKAQTPLSREIENLVIKGGLTQMGYNSDIVSITVGGGIYRYVLDSLFLPLREMKRIYPSLEKYPLLLPFYYMKRAWTKSIGNERDRTISILKARSETQSDVEDLMREIGLS